MRGLNWIEKFNKILSHTTKHSQNLLLIKLLVIVYQNYHFYSCFIFIIINYCVRFFIGIVINITVNLANNNHNSCVAG